MIEVNASALPLGLLLKYLQKLNDYVLCRDRSHIIFQNCYLIKLFESKVEEKATRFLALVAPEGRVVWRGHGGWYKWTSTFQKRYRQVQVLENK